MSLFSQIAKNTIYQIFGKFFGTILGLITIGLMTRYLGQTGYGYFTTITAFMQFFGVLADFGLQMTATQMISKPGADSQKIFNNIFALRFFSALIFLGSAAAIGWFLPYPLIVKFGISIVSLSFFFILTQSVLISICQKEMAMAKAAIAEVGGRAVLLFGVIITIFYQQNLLFIVGTLVASNLISFLILFSAASQYQKISFSFDWQIWKKIWQTAWPLAMSIALSLVYFRADTIILSLFRSPDEVGIYGATYKVLEILIQFPYLLMGLLLPLLTQFFIANKKIFDLIFQKTFDFLAIIAAPMVLSVFVLGEKIMAFVAGNKFVSAGNVLKIIILAVAIIYLKSLFGYTIAACELQKKMIKFYLFDAGLSFALYLALIPFFSYWAAAGLTVLSEFIACAAAFYILKKYAAISLRLKTAGKAIIAAVVMAGSLHLLNNQNLFTLIIIGLIIYFGILYALKGIDKKIFREIIMGKIN